MASFNHMDKGMNYFGDNGLSQQDSEQFYYGRDTQGYSSLGMSLQQQQQQLGAPQRAPLQAQALGMSGLRNGGSLGSLSSQDSHYLPQQPQQAHPMMSRIGAPATGPYGMPVGPSPGAMGHGGLQYSRSLIDDDASSVASFDSTGFPSLLQASGPRDTGDSFAPGLLHMQSRSALPQLHSLGDLPSLPPVMQHAALHNNEQHSRPTPPAGPTPAADNLEGRYGLMGLLDVIRMSDKDLNALALGSDLTTFGLNLNSSDSLFPSFSSPHMDGAAPSDPPFFTPKCYIMQPPSLKADHLAKFQVETLFYMFYAMPRDVLQATAAQELYRREWRYHAELKVWLKARGQQELIQGQPSIPFVYFDVNLWEAKLFTTPVRGNIAAGLLSEEDVRLKTPVGPLL